METRAFLNYWGHMPGLPPKSMPMNVSRIIAALVKYAKSPTFLIANFSKEIKQRRFCRASHPEIP